MELIKDKHVATHRILTFDVDDNGCMIGNTVRTMYFSGTDQEAFQRASEWKAQRDKEEPLGYSEEWGELKYIAHVWTLDEYGQEKDQIFSL